jgi:hypothetical protein
MCLDLFHETLTKEEEERGAIEDKNVGDMVNVCFVEQFHLFFCCTHEEEASCTQELDIMVRFDDCCHRLDLRKEEDIGSYSD